MGKGNGLKFKDGTDNYEVTGSSGNPYIISRNSTAAKERGVEWSCECMAWIIQKKYPCKHMREPGTVRLTPVKSVRMTPTKPVRLTPAKQVEMSLSPEERTDANRVLRETVAAGKVEKLGKIRYGFQLAHNYSKSDFVPGMVAEVKYDGELGMIIDGRLINRSGNDITDRFPEIEKTDKAVLVGEVVVLNKSGVSSFREIQERGTDDPLKIKLRSHLQPASFVAFDILEDRNLQKRKRDLTEFQFQNRRWHLEDFLKRNPLKGVQLIEQIPLSGNADIEKLLEVMREFGGEGLMVKNPNATYRAVRGRNWLKVKTWMEEEFNVIRYENTGIGDGFVIVIRSGEHEQNVNCGSHDMRKRIRAGHKRVEIKYLSKGADGALRFPSLRRLV